MSVWLEVGIGIIIIMGSVWFVKTIMSWNLYRKSIQTEIYSNYFEYAFRTKSLEKLSQSFYFKSRFGKHRICYQVVQVKNEKYPQAYVTVILSSGIYILRVMNQYPAKNPAAECRCFSKQITEKLKPDQVPVNRIIILPQKGKQTWSGTFEKEIPTVSRKEMFALLESDFKKNKGKLSEKQIDEIYILLAEDVQQKAAL